MTHRLPDTVEHWPLDRLIPYARNARTHADDQVAQIAASIVDFGWTNPILVDAEGVVVAGHGRLLAARRLGIDTVPVVVLGHLTPAQRRAYVLAVMTQIAVFPMLGLWPSLGENLALGAVFTGVSLLRSYCVRRAFENWRLRLERQSAAGS